MRKITIAHSPDADDIFMYYAIKFGWIRHEDMFENLALDIQTLNQEALKNTYDITAISFGVYPLIKNDYGLLKTAISFGNGYGPKMIKLKSKKLGKNFTLGLSGKHTTNALLFKIKYPAAKIKYYNFLDIEEAVLKGEIDAGVLIHESILTYSDKLEVESELWDIWQELSKQDNLPLPLGGMAIRRSIPLHRAIEYEDVLTKAVEIASANKEILSNMLIQRDLIRVDNSKLQIYLGLYANQDSISLSSLQFDALDKLFEIGYNSGYYKELIKSRDYIIPNQYNKIRFN